MIFTDIKQQAGQTLVETMVAIFVMVMGITAALGLAVYSFNATALVNKQIIGLGLSREGMEAVKNMRDTNWLQSNLFNTSCNCYTDWRTSFFSFSSNTTGKTFVLDFNPVGIYYWTFTPENVNFRLDYSPNAVDGRFYYPGNATDAAASDFYRRITLTENTSAPYDSTSPRILVTSDVWWRDTKCPDVATYEASKASCRVRLQTYLTNWKNY